MAGPIVVGEEGGEQQHPLPPLTCPEGIWLPSFVCEKQCNFK
jgi:hypothetical protein